MPESSGSIVEIHNSLKASLGRGHSDLDQDVVAASKRVLLENILFVPASAPYTMQLDALKAKYISLNPAPVKWDGDKSSHQLKDTSSSAMSSQTSTEKSEDVLPAPKVILYPEEKVMMEWTRMTRIGAGLVNMGNTCFFNSTLQCLTYTAPLVNYCLSNDHRSKCKKKDFCMMCEIQSHIKSSLDCGGRSIKPHSMLQKLRCIAKHMKWGRQEDAHEFLRFVVDHLQQSCLNGESKLDQLSKDTTVINQIFGGYLRSQVICLRCQARSNTFDPFMDISLDIKGVNTVEEALAKFVKPETLEQDNAYKCPKCKHKVKAQKRFSIQKAPNILTLQLNRFDFHRHLSGKINRFIKYPEKINLRSFMSQKQGEPILYHLYGVLVHSGHSSEHGHYYSYVKSPTKTWYCMNDSIVHQAAYNNVFNADAYVLFYARINKPVSTATTLPPGASTSSGSSASVTKGPLVGTSSSNKPAASINGIQGKSSSDVGTPLKRQEIPSSESKIVPHAPSGSALPGVYTKISFPILTTSQKKLFQQQQEDGKRIVLQIKHGNSTTMEKSPDGKSKVVNHGGTQQSQQSLGLVPYNSDSDSEQDNVSTGASKSVSSTKESTKFVTSNDKSGDNPQTSIRKINFPSTSHEMRPITEMGDAPASKPLLASSSHTSSTSSLQSVEPSKHSSEVTLKGSFKNISAAAATLPGITKNGPVTVELSAAGITASSSNSCPKVRSTGGNWLIQSQDCAPSPRSSCSSANSVNSTTEWTVESKEIKNSNPESGIKSMPKGQEGTTAMQCKEPTDKVVPLVSPLHSPESSHSSTKKAKKHKKKKLKSSSDEDRKRKDHSKKKKKHKEKKRKREKERKSSDYDLHERKKRKYSRSSSSSSSASDSEEDYEWVEKTKETAGLIQPKTGPVTVQTWNHHVKDDVAPKKDDSDVKAKNVWDGSRSSGSHLDSESSSFSLGKNVLSWDGGKNHIDDDFQKDNKKRRFSELYNEEIDSGKVKKVKKVSENMTYSRGYNPFQQYHSDQYQSEKNRDSVFWKQDHSYYQNNHQATKNKTFT
ncbi:ubiquitin carboxyl-terminal hydrolase 36 isoform X1 [Biomphalaria glabrata]|nr:ubiquitin carboxyl-terminal hydrolase 36 isoform X1 [Biomphalaria glabrata]